MSKTLITKYHNQLHRKGKLSTRAERAMKLRLHICSTKSSAFLRGKRTAAGRTILNSSGAAAGALDLTF